MSSAEAAAPVFAALGDPTRLALVTRLAGGGTWSIAALTADRGMTRQAVSKHLRVLEAAGLIETGRAGRERRVALHDAALAAARAYLDGVAAQWGAALARLKAHVEADAPAQTFSTSRP